MVKVLLNNYASGKQIFEVLLGKMEDEDVACMDEEKLKTVPMCRMRGCKGPPDCVWIRLIRNNGVKLLFRIFLDRDENGMVPEFPLVPPLLEKANERDGFTFWGYTIPPGEDGHGSLKLRQDADFECSDIFNIADFRPLAESPEPERKSIKRGRVEDLLQEKPQQKSAAKAPESAKVPDLPARLEAPVSVQILDAPTPEQITGFFLSTARALYPHCTDAEAILVAAQLSRKVPPFIDWSSCLVSLQSAMSDILNNPLQRNEAFLAEVDAVAKEKFRQNDPTVRTQAIDELKKVLFPSVQLVANNAAEQNKASLLKDSEKEKERIRLEIEDEKARFFKKAEKEKVDYRREIEAEKTKILKAHEAKKAELEKELVDIKYNKMVSLDQTIEQMTNARKTAVEQMEREHRTALAADKKKKLDEHTALFANPEVQKKLQDEAVQKMINGDNARISAMAVDKLITTKGDSLRRQAQEEAARDALLSSTNALSDAALIEKEKNDLASFFSGFSK